MAKIKIITTILILILFTNPNVYTKNFPSRIISLTPSITEILFAVGAGRKLVGVSSFSNYPPEAQKITKIGSYINLNLEKIVYLKPDIVIGIWGNNRRIQIKKLKHTGIRVYMAKDPRSIQDVLDIILNVSSVVGSYEKGRELVRLLKKQIHKESTKVQNMRVIRVFFQINNKPIITVSQDTFQSDLIRLAKGMNIAEGMFIRYPKISIEQVIAKKPEVILISCMEINGMFEEVKRQWLKWSCIPAAKKHRVYIINSNLVDRPGPRLVQALRLLIRLIHSEVRK